MLHAAVSTGILDQVLQEFLQALQHDYTRIEELAKGLFYYLAGLQIAISAIWLMFKGDPIEATVKTIQIFFTISVFYTLVLFGGSWMPQLINGFISIGTTSSGINSLTPSSVMGQGVSIGFAIIDNFSHWGWITHPFGSLLTCAILIAIIILYALLAAEIAIILIKSYVLISLSGLMFAFGANEAVRPIAMNYFKAVIGIGLQLLVFYLIMGVGVQIGHDWATLIGQAAKQHELKPFLVVMAGVIVFYMVVKNVPPFIAGLSGIGGFRSYGDAAVGSAMTAGGVGARAAMSAATMGTGGAAGIAQAGKGAFQAAASMAQGAKSGMRAHHVAGRSAMNVGASVGGSIKDSVMKANQHMSFGQKFNAKMSQRMSQQAAQASKASSPGGDFKSNQVKK